MRHVGVPEFQGLKLRTLLVGHRQVFDNTVSRIAELDVAFRALAGDGHLACLRYTGITVLAEHHADVQVLQLRLS